jgi:hypothetical protein
LVPGSRYRKSGAMVRVPKTPTKYDSQGVDSARREQAVLCVQKTGESVEKVDFWNRFCLP